MEQDHRKHTAYHEAGHAIACDELGVAHDGLSVVPDKKDGSAGRIAMEDSDDEFWIRPGTDRLSPENQAAFQAWAEDQAVIDFAGHAAVVVLLGIGDMSDESARRHGAHSDFDNARQTRD